MANEILELENRRLRGQLQTAESRGHCQLNRTPLYSPSMAWHTCPMNAAPRVRRALSSYQ